MRLSLIFLLFVISVLFVTSVATYTVFELVPKVKDIRKSLVEIFSSIYDHEKLLDAGYSEKDKDIFSDLDSINVQINDINEQLHGIDEDVNIVVKLLNNLPGIIQTELKLQDIRQMQNFLEVYYSDLEKYVRDFDEYENSTLLEFANTVVSAKDNSVPFLMKLIYRQVTGLDFLYFFSKYFAGKQMNDFCVDQQSLPEVFHEFFNEIVVLNMKSYILTKTAYMIKKRFQKGHFLKEIQDSDDEFKTRTNGLIKRIKSYMVKASTELRRCEPEKHVEGETFVQIRNFLHGYVINKVNIEENGRCRQECDAYTYTETQKCNGNKWCEKEPGCPKIISCQYVDSSMKVCSKKMQEDNRRYQYITYGNGEVHGKQDSCPSKDETSLKTYFLWLIWKCSYCLCLCDEGPKYFSDRYINLRPTLTNLTENRVVTGVRFIKHNQIIHLQIQEGKLLPSGQIDPGSVRWIPPENYTVTDKNRHNDTDYHTITWDDRKFVLADIKARNGSVVTGVQFKKHGTLLHLEIQTTPFDFTSGQLKSNKSIFEQDPNLKLYEKFGLVHKLTRPDVPTLSPSPQTDFTTNKYVEFVNSDLVKDAAQTTVPFFDAQPVASAKPVPLAGIGVFHKGRSGYGGFITPRIFTYNFGRHLELPFPSSNDRRLRKN